MKPTAFALYLGSVWQVLRFIVLAALVLMIVYPRLDPGFVLFLIWPMVAELALASAFFFLARRSDRYASYRNLLLLAKVLDVVPGVMLLAYQVIALYVGIGVPLFTIVPVLDFLTPELSAVIFYYSLVCIVLFDLIFLFVLISWRRAVGPGGIAAASSDDAVETPESPLPELSEIELEDE